MTNQTSIITNCIMQLAAIIGIIAIALHNDGSYTSTVLIGLITYIGGTTATVVAGHFSSAYVANKQAQVTIATTQAIAQGPSSHSETMV